MMLDADVIKDYYVSNLVSVQGTLVHLESARVYLPDDSCCTSDLHRDSFSLITTGIH